MEVAPAASDPKLILPINRPLYWAYRVEEWKEAWKHDTAENEEYFEGYSESAYFILLVYLSVLLIQ